MEAEQLQTFVSYRYAPTQFTHRHMRVPYQPVIQYTFNNSYGYQRNAIPHNYMAAFSPLEPETIFDQECPDLTSQASPAASSLGSGASFAPSPPQDVKDMAAFGNGLPVDSPSNLSPLTDFGFADARCASTLSSAWDIAPTLPCSNPPMQLVSGNNWLNCMGYPTQSQLSSSFFTPEGLLQPEPCHEDLYKPAPFKDLYSQAAPSFPTIRLSQQIMAPPFMDHGEDGLVAPGHLFNTALDKYAVMPPTSTHLSQDVTANALQHDGPTSILANDLVEFGDEHDHSMAVPLLENTRNLKDDYLREARRRGLSYKEIKRRGGFTEAESTLRGRVRILSKPKEMRVRKPQWRRADIVLLHRAVEALASQGSSSKRSSSRQVRDTGKLPWKKVAEHMQANGASYPFAGATCAKKWEQVRNLQV